MFNSALLSSRVDERRALRAPITSVTETCCFGAVGARFEAVSVEFTMVTLGRAAGRLFLVDIIHDF